MALIAFGLLLPTWLILPPDDEGLFLEVSTSWFQARNLPFGWFWNPWPAFGIPEPLSQAVSFHPFLAFVGWAPTFAIGFLYQLQFTIGLIAVWAVCRHLRIRPWIALVCTITFALCTASVNYLRDFWPVTMVEWTFSPLLLLFVLRLLDAERRSSRAVYAVLIGLCSALMLLDGHAGVFPVYVLGFAAFLTGRIRRLREVWPWLGAAVLVFALCSSTRFLDVGLEYFRSQPGERHQQIYPMSWRTLLFYPYTHGEHGFRLLAIGGPFMVLTVIGLAYRRISQRNVNALRIGAAFSFAAWFFGAQLFPPIAGNFFFRDPFSLFAIFLAGLTLQALWDRHRVLRPLLLAGVGLQVFLLIWGIKPFYRQNFNLAVDYLQGKPVPTLRNTFKQLPLYAYFEARPNPRSTRVYMAPGANDRLTRSISDYEFAGWGFHGLRLVNGHFRGVDLHELLYVKETLLSEIWGDTSLPNANLALNVLNIGYVLATPKDHVAPSLQRLRSFTLSDGTVIVVYRNPHRWPDAAVLAPEADAIDSLPARAGCDNPGLLCANFSQVVRLRRADAVASERWQGTSLDVRLNPSSQGGVLMLSQIYRPGWQAELSNGTTVDGHELLGGLTGFDLPPGVTSAHIVFRPVARMAFAALSWASILAAFAFVGAVWIRRRRRARQGSRLP